MCVSLGTGTTVDKRDLADEHLNIFPFAKTKNICFLRNLRQVKCGIAERRQVLRVGLPRLEFWLWH